MATDELDLRERKCEACSAETPTLTGDELYKYHDKLEEGWKLVDDHHLEKSYSFKNFRQGLDFTVKIGEMSEEEGHHPDIYLTWGEVRLKVFTHSIDGLSENDFIWAAKAEAVYEEL